MKTRKQKNNILNRIREIKKTRIYNWDPEWIKWCKTQIPPIHPHTYYGWDQCNKNRRQFKRDTGRDFIPYDDYALN